MGYFQISYGLLSSTYGLFSSNNARLWVQWPVVSGYLAFHAGSFFSKKTTWKAVDRNDGLPCLNKWLLSTFGHRASCFRLLGFPGRFDSGGLEQSLGLDINGWVLLYVGDHGPTIGACRFQIRAHRKGPSIKCTRRFLWPQHGLHPLKVLCQPGGTSSWVQPWMATLRRNLIPG